MKQATKFAKKLHFVARNLSCGYQHAVGPLSSYIFSANFSNPFLPGFGSDLHKTTLRFS